MDKIDDVVRELGLRHDDTSSQFVSRGRIKDLMSSREIELLGAVYAFVTNPDAWKRIDPPLTFDDYYEFMTKYYERCLRENPQSAWADSRFSAGTDLVNWFASLWNDETVPRSALLELKVWLGRLYSEGDSDLRTSIVQSTLESLFEQKTIRQYFDDWKTDPVLGSAYKEAMHWVDGGGRTPLGKPEWFRRAKSAEHKS